MPSLLCYGARGYCRCNWELTLYPNIGMHILHTVLYTFPKVLTRENLLNRPEPLELARFSFIPLTLKCDSGGGGVKRRGKEKSNARHSKESKS